LGQAIGQALPFAVGISLSPIPIIGVVLMLATPRARVNGLAFLAGWIVGLAVVGTIVLLISSGASASEDGAPADWVNWMKIVLGVGLLSVAVKQWRGRPRAGEGAEMPSWMTSVDHFGPAKAAGLGTLLSAVNPKNLVLILGAAAAIAGAGLDAGQDTVAMAIFIVIATLGPGIPVVLYLVMGERSRHWLDELRSWMAQNNAAIMAVICLLIAAKLIGDGISGF
jgi:threonine/homoserine/homoserine lactone efflux protein